MRIAVILLVISFSTVFSAFQTVFHKEMDVVIPTADQLFESHIKSVYDSAQLNNYSLDYSLFQKAMTGFTILKAEGKINHNVLSVIDFRKASTQERLWIIDLDENKLLYHSLVAHGRNSGDDMASNFSNTPSSNMSSIGFYVTNTTYSGKHGLSLIIDGQEKGWNDNARDRAVVIHSADYVSKEFIQNVGRLGRSQGCPAICKADAEGIITCIKEASCLFIYYPIKKYEATSKYLNHDAAVYAFTTGDSVTVF